MFAYFGMQHTPLSNLAPQNTNAGIKLPGTTISEQDVKEYIEVINLLPPALLERIEYLRGYEPECP
jgi:hypothetical protein